MPADDGGSVYLMDEDRRDDQQLSIGILSNTTCIARCR